MPEFEARVGFIGCGGHANNKLYPSIAMAPEVNLVAICDQVEEKAIATAAKYGSPTVYTDMDKMIDAESLDAVIISGPPQMHVEVGNHCLSRGLHIYVEKPSAITSAEAQGLADTAAQNNVKGICGFMKRYSCAYRAAQDVMARPTFGDINMAEVRFTQGPYPQIWGIEENMRAFLIGQLVHIFDLTRFLCGDVSRVFARLNQVTEDMGAYAVSLEFASGAVGTMSLNAVASDSFHFNEWVNITGSREWLEVEDMLYLKYHPLKGWMSDAFDGERSMKNQTQHWQPALSLEYRMLEVSGYVGELRDLARIAATDAEPIASLADCAEALRIGEAIWESAQTGREATVEGK